MFKLKCPFENMSESSEFKLENSLKIGIKFKKLVQNIQKILGKTPLRKKQISWLLDSPGTFLMTFYTPHSVF